MNLISFYKTTVGKKLVVAVTGLIMVGFVVGHMAGNLKAFGGTGADGVHKLDHYAEFLHNMGADLFGHEGVLWIVRIVLLAAVFLHIITVIKLQKLNKAARPLAYISDEGRGRLATSLMFYGGLTLAFFIIFHILHLTTGNLHWDFKEGQVFHNISVAFKNPFITFFYVACMGFMGLHLYHGIWSVTQTLGLNTLRYDKLIRRAAMGIAVGVVIGFCAVPVSILLGII